MNILLCAVHSYNIINVSDSCYEPGQFYKYDDMTLTNELLCDFLLSVYVHVINMNG